MERIERSRRRAVTLDLGTADAGASAVGRALRALSDADLVRLKALARLWSRGLPCGLGWSDILHEAILRALDGSRRWPPEVPLLAFLSGVMRSICDEHWRRARRERQWRLPADPSGGSETTEAAAAAPSDPERVLAAAQALAAVHRLFAADAAALKIIAGLTEGLTADEIRRFYGMSERDYDSARKRMRRALLRCGMTWGTP